MKEFHHVSVLLQECIDGLNIKPDGIYVDGTLGGAGHSSQIAKRLTTGRLIGIDRDPVALAAAEKRLEPYKDRVTLGVNCGHRCLTVYTAADWKTLGENYNALPISHRSAATSLIFMNATECNPDKQFRFTLTQNLLSFAKIGRDVIIVGRAGQAEIWDAEEYKHFEEENLTPEKLLASLEAIGL